MDRLGVVTLTQELRRQGKDLRRIELSPREYSRLAESVASDRFLKLREVASPPGAGGPHMVVAGVRVAEDVRLKPGQVTLTFETSA